MKKHSRWAGRALGAALLAGSLGACDFISVTDRNPNTVPDANLDQLFTAAQVSTFSWTENQIARIAAMWTQQASGTDRQFSTLGTYIINESSADDEFSSIYTSGGLVDLRQAIAKAETQNRRVYAGILKVHEAYLVGMTASIFGDIPYSEAVNPEIKTPKLDKQEEVYAAVQKLLDTAIADLASGAGAGPAGVDLNFGGNAARWRAVANTLKARFYLHWIEAQMAGVAAANTACGGNCIDKAIASAQQGIQAPAGNWYAVHGESSTEQNTWYQFLRDRSGYISAGAFEVNLLKSRNDPRLAIYYTPNAAGQFVGSEPGENLSTASSLNIEPAQRMPILTCAENQYILAEAQYYKGNLPAARTALQAGIACQEARFGVKIPPVNASSLAGPALLAEIATQKYIALFLNTEAFNDYKRTCMPAIKTFQGKTIPRRFFYGQQERRSNPNIPAPEQQPLANTNDPKGC